MQQDQCSFILLWQFNYVTRNVKFDRYAIVLWNYLLQAVHCPLLKKWHFMTL